VGGRGGEEGVSGWAERGVESWDTQGEAGEDIDTWGVDALLVFQVVLGSVLDCISEAC